MQIESENPYTYGLSMGIYHCLHSVICVIPQYCATYMQWYQLEKCEGDRTDLVYRMLTSGKSTLVKLIPGCNLHSSGEEDALQN